MTPSWKKVQSKGFQHIQKYQDKLHNHQLKKKKKDISTRKKQSILSALP